VILSRACLHPFQLLGAASVARRKFLALAAGAVAVPAMAHIARGQAYPSAHSRWSSRLARAEPWISLGVRPAELLGQQVVVGNVSGAGGMTGVARVAKAAPDGYQLALGKLGTQFISQTLYKHPLYNTVTDLTQRIRDRILLWCCAFITIRF
jgi:Tripartite tricarboxylate transporter family receptor